MSNFTLEFYGDKYKIEMPRSLSSLRKTISDILTLSPEDVEEIILEYTINKDTQEIKSNKDIKTFLNSKIFLINLKIRTDSRIFLANKNKVIKQYLKDFLDKLVEEKSKLKKLKDKKFSEGKEKIEEIESKIMELSKRKEEITKRIKKEEEEFDKKKNEIQLKIIETQNKIDQLNNGPEIKGQQISNIKAIKSPAKLNDSPDIFRKKNIKDGNTLDKKLGNYKESQQVEKLNEINEEKNSSKRIIDEKNRQFDQTHEISKKISEKSNRIKGLSRSLNDPEISKDEEDKKRKGKKEKVIHYFIKCKECQTIPIEGKRFKCKKCNDLNFCEKCYEKNKESHRHEFEIIEISIFKRPISKKRPINNHIFNQNNHDSGRKSNGIPLKCDLKKMKHCPTMENFYKSDNNIIPYINCSKCGKIIICGCRYKCYFCKDFYFCEECEKKYSESHNHPFLKING